VLIGTREVCTLLQAHDDEFDALFGVVADVDDDMPRSAENTQALARALAARMQERGRLAPTAAAPARTIDHGIRLAEDGTRISAQLRRLLGVLQEADHLASAAGRPAIDAPEVDAAIRARRARAARMDAVRARGRRAGVARPCGSAARARRRLVLARHAAPSLLGGNAEDDVERGGLRRLNPRPSLPAHKRSESDGQMNDHWEHFEHGADIGVRGLGMTKASAFAQAALGLTAVITDPAGVRPLEAVRIDCAAPDDELLLAAWLNAVVYEMAVRRMLFGRFEVELAGGVLHARALGEPVSVERHEPAVEIKGATYTMLRVAPTADGGWLAQTVVDV
jgi:tRNA nucleotidyltransferase (CCA-adding enzyme)